MTLRPHASSKTNTVWSTCCQKGACVGYCGCTVCILRKAQCVLARASQSVRQGTALIIASAKGREEDVEILLRAGADVKARDQVGDERMKDEAVKRVGCEHHAWPHWFVGERRSITRGDDDED